VSSYTPSLKSGETINIKNGAHFTADGNSTFNAGSLIIEQGGTLDVNGDLNFANPNNRFEGTLTVSGILKFNNAPNYMSCPGKIVTNDLVNASGTPPLQGEGYIEVQNNFTGSNPLTNSSAIVLNLTKAAVTSGNKGAASSGTESSCSPSTLPTEIKSFKAGLTSAGVQLVWISVTELNNKSYIIERSNDGIHYLPVGTQISKAANGNSTKAIDYSFLDSHPLNGLNYYRIKQIDFNDQANYYNKTVSIKVSGQSHIRFFPNPVKNTLYISGVSGQDVTYNIVDANGKRVLTTRNTTIAVGSLAKGIYFIQMVDGSVVSNIGKFVKN